MEASQPVELEVVTPTALEAITNSEISQQIATAHKFPRSMEAFKKRALNMALIDEETAASCIYCRPVGKKDGKQQYAEGLSIRLAEIVGASYGNIRVGSMIIEQTDRFVKCRGAAHDLESNFASTSECIEPTVKSNGEPFSESMRNVVAKACLAKAWRDALFKVVPRALCKPIEAATRELIAGNTQSLEKRRRNVMIWLKSLSIDLERVWAALDVKGEDDLTNQHLLTLAGLRTAIKDGETPVEEAFPRIIPESKIGAKPGEKAPETVTEAAQQEAAREKGGDQSTASKPETPTASDAGAATTETKGPTAKELIAQIMKKARELGMGKAVVTARLIDAGFIKGEQTVETLDAKTAANVLDAWDEIVKEDMPK